MISKTANARKKNAEEKEHRQGDQKPKRKGGRGLGQLSDPPARQHLALCALACRDSVTRRWEERAALAGRR